MDYFKRTGFMQHGDRINAAQQAQLTVAAQHGSQKAGKLTDYILPKPVKGEAGNEAAAEMFAAGIAQEAGL